MVRRKKCRKNCNKLDGIKQNENFISEDYLLKGAGTSSNKPNTSTPLCTPKPPMERSTSRTSIKTTPVNKRRSNNRRRNSFNRTMNVTNLNILFDSSYINQNASPQEERRSPKFLRANESTQTINIDDDMKSEPEITETPKISHLSLLEELVSQVKSPVRIPLGNNKNLQDKQSGIEIVFNRLKRLSRTSIRWSYKIVDFCNYIGVALKRSLSSICSVYPTENVLSEEDQTPTVICKCNEYKCEIRNCMSKIEQLTTELVQIRSQLGIQTDHGEKIRLLSEDLHQVKENLEQFRQFKNDFSNFKDQFKNNQKVTTPSIPIPVAPPPPPPPPPLPSLLPPKNSPIKLATKKSNKSNKENSRPIISLDDILKVKLKKAAVDRPSPHRRNTQPTLPTVSTEMLKQVKLKPPTRQSTPLDIESLSTSPSSSLTRLLSDNNSTQPQPVGQAGEGEDIQLNGLF